MGMARLAAAAVSRVFLTGGSCLVLAVRRLFTERFGPRLLGKQPAVHVESRARQ
jgi:hypothetical protein